MLERIDQMEFARYKKKQQAKADLENLKSNKDVDKVSTTLSLLVEAYHGTDALRGVNEIPYFYTVSPSHRSAGVHGWLGGKGCCASSFTVYLLGLVSL